MHMYKCVNTCQPTFAKTRVCECACVYALYLCEGVCVQRSELIAGCEEGGVILAEDAEVKGSRIERVGSVTKWKT